MDLFPVGVYLPRRFEYIVDMTLGVDPPRYREPDELHIMRRLLARLRILFSEHYASYLDAAYPRMGVKPAEQCLGRVLELRELLFRMLSAVTKKQRISEEDLDRFNDLVAEAMSNVRITQTDEGFD